MKSFYLFIEGVPSRPSLRFSEFECSESKHPIHFGKFSVRSCRGFGQHGQQQQLKHQINQRGSVIGIHGQRHEPSRQYSPRENKSHTNTTEHGMMICFTTGSSQPQLVYAVADTQKIMNCV